MLNRILARYSSAAYKAEYKRGFRDCARKGIFRRWIIKKRYRWNEMDRGKRTGRTGHMKKSKTMRTRVIVLNSLNWRENLVALKTSFWRPDFLWLNSMSLTFLDSTSILERRQCALQIRHLHASKKVSRVYFDGDKSFLIARTCDIPHLPIKFCYII